MNCTNNCGSSCRCTVSFDRPISWPQGQFLTRQSGCLERFVTAAIVAAVLAASAAGGACRSKQSTPSTVKATTKDGAPQRGGNLVASIRTEPGSFNRYVNRDSGAELVSLLTHAKLVRI